MTERKMEMNIIIALLIFLSVMMLGVDYLIAWEFYVIAKEKGHDERKYLWISFFLGIIGYLLVIALPDRKMKYSIDSNSTHQGQNSTDASSTYDDLPEL